MNYNLMKIGFYQDQTKQILNEIQKLFFRLGDLTIINIYILQ